MRISDWSSDVCSSDLESARAGIAESAPWMAHDPDLGHGWPTEGWSDPARAGGPSEADFPAASLHGNHHTPHCARPRPHRRTPKATSPKASRRKSDNMIRSEEHTSELQ